MSYNELKQHGTADFPIGLYQIDHTHPKYQMAYHWHTEHEVIRVLSGTLYITLNNRSFTATAGDIIYVNGEVVHGAVPQDCVYECIVFSPGYLSMPGSDFFDGLLGHNIYVESFFSHDEPKHEHLRGVVNAVFEALREDSEGQRYFVVGGFYQMLGWIAEHHLYSENLGMQFRSARDEKNVQKLKNVLSYIRHSYDQQISLVDMANVAGISPQYFCAFFKSMTDKSPIEYVTSYRIERASRKLLTTDSSVTEIAYSCGFNDLSYFIKTFKAEKGMTPRSFRRTKVNS
ncbi:MAG: helix-turn-helix transcriptional regulator [Clostridia bacterium]|nr:helix-turn-helix transcriptional regulator [Clostridia bacterium]